MSQSHELSIPTNQPSLLPCVSIGSSLAAAHLAPLLPLLITKWQTHLQTMREHKSMTEQVYTNVISPPLIVLTFDMGLPWIGI